MLLYCISWLLYALKFTIKCCGLQAICLFALKITFYDKLNSSVWESGSESLEDCRNLLNPVGVEGIISVLYYMSDKEEQKVDQQAKHRRV